jgi:hypothetical protein
MDSLLLEHFQHQTYLQCRFVLIAAKQLDEAMSQRGGVTDIFYSLQNLLTSAVNISKALWGTGDAMAEARKPLRESIGISDDSPIKDDQLRQLRNKYEHFDEKLDDWWKQSEQHILLDLIVAPKSAFAIEGAGKKDWFRHYDPKTKCLTFWDQQVDVQAIRDEVTRLLLQLEAASGKYPA